MLVGPALGGILIAQVGAEACYAVDAVMFLAALYGVVRLPAMRPLEHAERPSVRWRRTRGWRSVR